MREFRDADGRTIRLSWSGDVLVAEFLLWEKEKPLSVLRTRGRESNEVIQWLKEVERARP